MLPPEGAEGTARANKILEGMKAAGDTHLWTGPLGARLPLHGLADLRTVDGHRGCVHPWRLPRAWSDLRPARQGYSRQPARPAVLLETNYENEHNVSTADIRSYMWGAALSAVGGVIFGSAPLWFFPPDWQKPSRHPGRPRHATAGGLPRFDSLVWFGAVGAERDEEADHRRDRLVHHDRQPG